MTSQNRLTRLEKEFGTNKEWQNALNKRFQKNKSARHLSFIHSILSGNLNEPISRRFVAKVKAALASGMKGREVARMFDMPEKTVSLIKTGRRWANVGVAA